MSERSLTQTTPFRIAGHRVEPASLRVSIDGGEARLEAKVMLVLAYLAEHAGRVVSRLELEQQLWPGRIVTEDSVTKAVAKLRRVFRDDAHHPRVIETVPKSGYRLIAEVTWIDDEAADGMSDSVPARTARYRLSRPTLRWWVGGVSVLALVLGTWWLVERARNLSAPPAPLSGKPALAVVPLDNLGASPDDDYFANGITADLITDLSKVKGLLVIAPGMLSADRNSGAKPRRVSAALEVDYLVTGSVQRLADTLRINVQLIEAGAERTLWAERYTGSPDDVFDIQDRLTAAVIAALAVELAPDERAHLAMRPTASAVAYDAYLRGLGEHGSRTEAQNLSARSHFEKAIQLDPTFARAYTGLALTYSREAIDGWAPDPSRSLERAARLADQAAAMDPSLPQAHFVTGQVRLFQRRHARAIEAAERALEVAPNYADAYALLAWTLNYAGRPGKASSALEWAMRLNPAVPASYLEILGEIQFARGGYEDSASTFRRVLDINPGYLRARMWSAAALVRAGADDMAQWEVVELLTASPRLAIERLEYAFPFKDPRPLATILHALRQAGLPER